MTDALKDYPVILTQAVRWGDMDSFDHVNNTVYFKYFEDARIAYFDKIGALLDMDDIKLGPILANAHTDFRAPLTYPDTVSIACKITDMHEKKFTMQFVVYSHAQKQIAAEGDGLIVYFDYKNKITCEVPEEIISRIKKLEKAKI